MSNSSQTPKWTRGTPIDSPETPNPETTSDKAAPQVVENLLQQKREARLKAQKEESLDKAPSSLSQAPSPEKSPAQDKETNSSSSPQLKEEPKEELREDSPPPADPTSSAKSSSSLGLYILISVCLCLLFALGYLIKVQRDELPETDPYELAEQTYKQTYDSYIKAKLKSLELEQNMLKAQKLQSSYNQLIQAKELMAVQQQQKIALQDEIDALKKEMLTYYKRYKSLTQKQARGIYLDHLVTRSGKEFSEVSIRECNNRQISIIHSEGSIRLPLVDLPDALLDRLAYSHPFADLLEERNPSKTLKTGQAKASVVFGQDPAKRDMDPNEESLLPDLNSYDPPSKAPSVSSPTHLEKPDSPKATLPSLEEAVSMSEPNAPQPAKEGQELLRPSEPVSPLAPQLDIPEELELPEL